MFKPLVQLGLVLVEPGVPGEKGGEGSLAAGQLPAVRTATHG
jgi:hypothetical protein